MKVLLVNPYRDYDKYLPPRLLPYCRYTAALENLDETWQPAEMAYLAAILRKNHDVDFIDAHLERRSLSAGQMEGYDAVVACTAPYEKWRCTQIFTAHATDLLEQAALAGARTVIYGPHVTVTPDAFSRFDARITDEPEMVVEDAVTSTEKGVYGPVPVPSLDLLPLPDYSIFDARRYRGDVVFEGAARGACAVITGSRGCPHTCSFCFKAMVSRTMARHSPENVERIAEDLVHRHGYKALIFADLTFSLDRNWTLDVCRRLAPLGVPYYVSTRVDCLDPELVDALALSGCRKIELGVETVSDKNLARMNKKITWEEVERGVALCRKAGIPNVSAFRMVFVPGETRETIDEFIEKCREMDLDLFPNICTPYPGTPLWNEGVREGKIRAGAPHWEDTVLAAGMVGNAFSREEITRISRELAWRSHRPYLRSIRKYHRTYGTWKLAGKIGTTLREGLLTRRVPGPSRRYAHVLGRTYILVRKRTLVPAVILDLLGYPAAGLLKLLRGEKHVPRPETIKKILAIRLDHIGDVLMTTPALRALNNLYPQATITCLVGSWAASIVETNPHAGALIEFDAPWFEELKTTRFKAAGYVKLARTLRAEGFDLCLDFRGDPRHLFLARFSGARYVVGHGIRGGGFLSDFTPPYRKQVHEVERNLDLVRALGAIPDDKSLDIFTTQEEDSKAGRLLEELDLEKGALRVAVCPYSRNPTRWWFDAGFTQLARWLVSELGAEVVFFGAPEHAERIEAIRRTTGQGVHSLAGRTTLREFAACLKRMDLIVSIESSPVHFASALGVPIVLLFSGTGLPEHWGPYKVPSRIVRSEAPCAPCFLIRCPRSSIECMEGITVEKVQKAICSLVEDDVKTGTGK